MDFIRWMDNLPKWAKVLFAIFLQTMWMIYRIVLSVERKATVEVILAFVLMLTVAPMLILKIIDIVTLISTNEILWFEGRHQ